MASATIAMRKKRWIRIRWSLRRDSAALVGEKLRQFGTAQMDWQSLGESNPSFQVENLAS